MSQETYPVAEQNQQAAQQYSFKERAARMAVSLIATLGVGGAGEVAIAAVEATPAAALTANPTVGTSGSESVDIYGTSSGISVVYNGITPNPYGNSEDIDFTDVTTGQEYTDTTDFTGSSATISCFDEANTSIQVCNLPGGEYSGYAQLIASNAESYEDVEFDLVGGSQGSGTSSGCEVGQTSPSGGTPVGMTNLEVGNCLAYDVATATGNIITFGGEPNVNQSYGNLEGQTLNKPIIKVTSTADGKGYWMLASDGGIFSFGDAGFYGSTGNLHLNAPIVAMAPTPDDEGYWLVASDGGIFSFGDAGFYGSTGNLHLNAPIVGMTATPDGKGYRLVASDGGIFDFGDASFLGSMGGTKLNKPIVGMTTTPDGKGYRLVASDGGVFDFGDAQFEGSLASNPPSSPIVDLAPSIDGQGYNLIDSNGDIFAEGDAPYFGGVSG
jgi:hypothetical protein